MTNSHTPNRPHNEQYHFLQLHSNNDILDLWHLINEQKNRNKVTNIFCFVMTFLKPECYFLKKLWTYMRKKLFKECCHFNHMMLCRVQGTKWNIGGGRGSLISCMYRVHTVCHELHTDFFFINVLTFEKTDILWKYFLG